MAEANPTTGHSEEQKITLFDLPTKPPRTCSSPNTWKIRATLNFQRVPYQTEWVDAPDIADRLKSVGIPENDPSAYTKYWLPAVHLPDGRYIMDSHKIAIALESLYPSPPIYASSRQADLAQELFDTIIFAIAPAYMYRIAEDLYAPEVTEWYHRVRGKLFGVENLREVPKLEPWAGEAPWNNANDAFKKVVDLLNEDQSGPFVMGSTPSYADFILGGLWEGFKFNSHDGDVINRVMDFDPTFKKHEEAVRPWFDRRTY